MATSHDMPATPVRGGARILGALGIVYGDLGTSPIYAMREAFTGEHAAPLTDATIHGVVSLVVWSLLIVIAVKYLWVVMRADDDGEGGIIALEALATRGSHRPKRMLMGLSAFGVFGTALLYGDGMITPAISVLSAVEGLESVATGLQPLVLPIAVAILVGLFMVQRHGTGRIGAVFGPVMLAWFSYLAITGVVQVAAEPGVLVALNPGLGIAYLLGGGLAPLFTLGAVFLVVTGSEALYADMGHFGRGPIARSFVLIVLPALILQYLGQGALLMRSPDVVDRLFYAMVPGWMLPAAVALTTMATVIASQALISGAFSLTSQAVQLGYLPRLRVEHTSDREVGQVYVPAVNWVLMLASIALVLGFGSSSRLAAAYGVAVVLTMLITTVLFYVVAVDHLGWPVWRARLACGGFLVVDLAFLGANINKIPDGGWFPLVVAGGIVMLMRTWVDGTRLVAKHTKQGGPLLATFIKQINASNVQRVPGSVVYLHGEADRVPPAMLTNLRRNHVLHASIALVRLDMQKVARVPVARRATVEPMGSGFVQVTLRFGFAEQPDVPAALASIVDSDFGYDQHDVGYVVGFDDVIASGGDGLMLWRERLYVAMRRNSAGVSEHLCLPPERVVQVGRPVRI